MKKIQLLFLAIILAIPLFAQNRIYTSNSSEIIFSFADVEKAGENVPTNLRFTMFFHLGQNINYDFNNHFGVFSGYGLRNVGFITENEDIKIKRRSYAFGIPLGIKAGLFDKHLYLYGGGEYSLFFHYKQKRFEGGTKTKYTEWFSERTQLFMPSAFGGIQFPGGINLKFRYYLKDFLNQDFRGKDFGEAVNYSQYDQTQVFYIALIFNFKKNMFKELYDPDKKSVRYASHSK